MKLSRAELAEAARDASTLVVKGTLLSDEAVLRLARAVLELYDVHEALARERAAARPGPSLLTSPEADRLRLLAPPSIAAAVRQSINDKQCKAIADSDWSDSQSPVAGCDCHLCRR